MRPIQLLSTPAAADLIGFASNVTGATFTLTANDSGDSLGHQVSIRNDTANSHAGKTITLVGTDPDGRALTEVVTGPGVSATVESAGYFLTLESATPSATIGADTFDIGWVDEFSTRTIPLNWRGADVALNVTVSGTIDYTIQQTFDDIQSKTTAFAFNNHSDTSLVTATTTLNGGYIEVPRATRAIVNSYSSGATLEYNIVQRDV
jgi:hypothetical protein